MANQEAAFAKIKPITFNRTIDALLLKARQDAREDTQTALHEAKAHFARTGSKGDVMTRLLSCYGNNQSCVVPTMQKLLPLQDNERPLTPVELMQAAMAAAPAPPNPLHQSSPAPPPMSHTPPPVHTPPAISQQQLQQHIFQQIMLQQQQQMGGPGAPKGRGRPPKMQTPPQAGFPGMPSLPGMPPGFGMPGVTPALAGMPGMSQPLPGMPPSFPMSSPLPGVPGPLPGFSSPMTNLPGTSGLPGVPGPLPGVLGMPPGLSPPEIAKRMKIEPQQPGKLPPPRPGGPKGPQPAPQLAADDVTHGGDGALAEQDVLSVDELALEQEALTQGVPGKSRSLKEVMPRYKEDYVLSMPSLSALMKRVTAQHGLQGVDPSCSILLALTVEAHLSQLLMATAKVAGQRLDPARHLPTAAPRGRSVQHRLQRIAAAGAHADMSSSQQGEAGSREAEHTAQAHQLPSQHAQQAQQGTQQGAQQHGLGPQPGQSLLPFKRVRPLFVRARVPSGTHGGTAAGEGASVSGGGAGEVGGEQAGAGSAGGSGGGSADGRPPPEQLVRPLGPSLLLKGPLSGEGDRGVAKAGTAPEQVTEAVPELTVDDLLVALERDTLLGRNSMVWRLQNRLLLEREGKVKSEQQQQQQQQQQDEGARTGVS